jgi:hypothetical protein
MFQNRNWDLKTLDRKSDLQEIIEEFAEAVESPRATIQKRA